MSNAMRHFLTIGGFQMLALASMSAGHTALAQTSSKTTGQTVSYQRNSATALGSEKISLSGRTAISAGNISLVLPQKIEVPSLAGDLNEALMSPEFFTKLEYDYQRQLRSFSYQYGFFATQRDSRYVQPYMLSGTQEITVRQDMAKAILRFMGTHGITRYLSSRHETKQYARAYQDVQQLARVSIETKNQIRLSTNWNAITGDAGFKLSKNRWAFETLSKIGFTSKFDLAFRLSTAWKTSSVDTTYNPLTKTIVNGYHHAFSPTLIGHLTNSFPTNAGRATWHAMNHTMAIEHFF